MEFFFIGLVVLLIWYYVSSNRKKAKEAKEDKRVDDLLTHLIEHQQLPEYATTIVLKGDEKCYYNEAAGLCETRAVRTYSGGGARIRVAKGVSIGGGQGSSSSRQEWKHLDTGTLSITNERIIFAGQKENRIFEFKKLVTCGLDKISGQIEISFSNRKKSARFSVLEPAYTNIILQFATGQGIPAPN